MSYPAHCGGYKWILLTVHKLFLLRLVTWRHNCLQRIIIITYAGLQNHRIRVWIPDMLLCSLLDKYPWERYEPPYPPIFGLNNTTTVLLKLNGFNITNKQTYVISYLKQGGCPVGWGCRIRQLLFCRGVRPPPQMSWIWH